MVAKSPVSWVLQLHSLCKAESSIRYSEDLEPRNKISPNIGEISPIFRLSVEVDTISSTDSRFDEISGNFR